MLRIAILGGRGLIGRALTRELRVAGHKVIVSTRDPGAKYEGNPSILYWDGVDEKKLSSMLDGCDVVVNLTGENIGAKAWTLNRKQLLYSSRVDTAGTLVKAIKAIQNKPTLIVQASAVGYYGVGEEAVDENSPNGSDWLAHLARDWEDPVSDLNERAVRTVIIRSGVVMAKEGSVLQRLTLPVRLFIGGPLGNGKQWISWIHIRDEVRAIRFLIEHEDCRGAYNLVSPGSARNREMEKRIAEILHRPYGFPTPAFLLKVALGEMSTIVLDGQHVLPKRLKEAGFEFEFGSVHDMLADLLNG